MSSALFLAPSVGSGSQEIINILDEKVNEGKGETWFRDSSWEVCPHWLVKNVIKMWSSKYLKRLYLFLSNINLEDF